jgi:hypothetical protein
MGKHPGKSGVRARRPTGSEDDSQRTSFGTWNAMRFGSASAGRRPGQLGLEALDLLFQFG